jgi:Spy/CpxP family protein refolding chaperone
VPDATKPSIPSQWILLKCTQSTIKPLRWLGDERLPSSPTIAYTCCVTLIYSCDSLLSVTYNQEEKLGMYKKLLIVTLLFVTSGGATRRLFAQTNSGAQSSSGGAQDKPKITDQDIELLRQDLRSQKKQIVATNLKLTDEQSTRFWPVYDQYIGEQTKIHDQKYAVIKEFATSWGTISDAQAEDLTKRALAVDDQVAQLRIKYMPNFLKVLPGKQVATFYQIDRRLQMMVDLQLMSQLPLLQSQ